MKDYSLSKTGMFSLFMLCISVKGFSQPDSSLIRFKNPPSVSTPRGYSHAAIVDLGNCQMVILSGQVPLDRDGNLVGKGDLARQTEQVFMNLKNIITYLGGTMDNMVKMGVYMLDASQIQAFRDIRNKYINVNNPPASTLVQVGRLFREDVLLEVEATVIIPKKK